MPNFNFYNVEIVKAEGSNQVAVKGEIENRSGRNYSAVAVRIVLFVKNIPVANLVLVVNGLGTGRTKGFEKILEELEYDKIAQDINRHEIYVESAY
ncbi:MAG: hypothetical protein FJZ09_00960 [Candidatus Omnitrophica bacterium]|nr:hypothetical protein [Candidatus Omnitrophota bacterium]